jgi:hypothetical protein
MMQRIVNMIVSENISNCAHDIIDQFFFNSHISDQHYSRIYKYEKLFIQIFSIFIRFLIRFFFLMIDINLQHRTI